MDDGERTVYIVDDNPAVRDSLALMLEHDGVKVRQFCTAHDFLDAYQPDFRGCIILDVRMPGMDGFQLQQELVDYQCKLPIIFLTGHGDIPMSVRAIKAGAVNFLTKPVSYSQLFSAVQGAFTKYDESLKEGESNLDASEWLVTLTKREREVLKMAVEGLSNKEIARHLQISYRTVEIYRRNMMRKAGVRNMLELARVVLNPEAKNSSQALFGNAEFE